jgi:hypothetical protein
MALLADTVLKDAIVKANTMLMQDFENRLSERGVIEGFLKSTARLVPESEIINLRTSARRATEIAVFSKSAATIRTARQITITPDGSTTDTITPTWVTRGFDVGVTEAINTDNAMSAQEDLANQIFQALKSAYFDDTNSIDKYLTAFLASSAWATPTASTQVGVVSTAAGYEIDREQLYTKIRGILRNLKFSGPFHDFANVEASATLDEMRTFGTANSQNRASLIANDFQFGYSHNIAIGTAATAGLTAREKHFFVPDGMIGLLNWVEDDAKKGHSGKTHDYGVYQDNLFGLRWGYMYTDGPENKSSTVAGLQRAFTQKWGFYTDIAAIKAYSSDSSTPVVQVLATSGTPS